MSILKKLVSWAACMPMAVLAIRPHLNGQAQKHIPVTGMTTGINKETGQRPVRWEVNALQSEGGPRWDLYIQGLVALRNRTETDERSHFSISGDTIRRMASSQILGSEIQRIAAKYSSHRNASAYKKAAQIFRLPYWDWAADPRLPLSCTWENITINGPRGRLTLRNPLYSYKWQTYPLDQGQFPDSLNWPPETTRASDGRGTFSPDAVNANLADVGEQLKEQVYRTFTSAESYDQMSSTANPAGISFEAPHNVVHNAVGGSFASVDVTSFDSLFMLHHANVDRLAALWTAIHFNATHMTKPYATEGLYATARGTNITALSPVKPFYRAANGNGTRNSTTFHTGLSVANIAAFGYTYPELVELDLMNGRDREQGRKAVIARINSLYGSGSNGNSSSSNGSSSSGADNNKNAGINPPKQREREEEEWFVEVAAERSELQLPCTIDIYIGEKRAGRMALLEMPVRGFAHSEISLQRTLRGLDMNTMIGHGGVEELLREQLRVEIKTGNEGAKIDAKSITSLELMLAAVAVTPRNSNEPGFPVYGDRSVYTKISLS
ncbi:hypothetical protein AAE478_007752 [Parahypoxylon ruwenzoriense]